MASKKLSWLEEVKKDAEFLTLKRIRENREKEAYEASKEVTEEVEVPEEETAVEPEEVEVPGASEVEETQVEEVPVAKTIKKGKK